MSLRFTSVADMPPGFWRWPHFDPEKEWADHVSGALVVVPFFMDRLEKLRRMFGRPLPIVSGYRTPEHNQRVSDTGPNGPHTTGRAADIRIYGADALDLIALAVVAGFTGIGLSQKGPKMSRFCHLDDLEAPVYPRPNCWTY